MQSKAPGSATRVLHSQLEADRNYMSHFIGAVEAVVDLMTVAHHPLAKIAKDSAAGAVFIASLGAVVSGYLIFYEGITAASARVYESLAQVPAHLAFVTLALVAIATVFAKAYTGGRSIIQGGVVSGHAALASAANGSGACHGSVSQG